METLARLVDMEMPVTSHSHPVERRESALTSTLL